MSKKAFTLFEVIVSLVVLSVALLMVSKLFVQTNHIEIYTQLQEAQNDYYENGVIYKSDTIKFQSHLDKITTQ